MRFLKACTFIALYLASATFAHQLSEQQIRQEFETHDLNKDNILTRQQFRQSTVQQIKHMGQQIYSDQMDQLVDSIMESVFQFDTDGNGIDIKQFRNMVQSQHDHHDSHYEGEEEYQENGEGLGGQDIEYPQDAEYQQQEGQQGQNEEQEIYAQTEEYFQDVENNEQFGL